MADQQLQESKRPLVPHNWAGTTDEGVSWRVEIEHDRFSTGEPFVVSMLVADTDDEGRNEGLATPTPTQARQMATALLVYAHFAEQANADEASARRKALRKAESALPPVDLLDEKCPQCGGTAWRGAIDGPYGICMNCGYENGGDPPHA